MLIIDKVINFDAGIQKTNLQETNAQAGILFFLCFSGYNFAFEKAFGKCKLFIKKMLSK